MEVATAPAEDEITPDITTQNVSEIETPKAHSILAHEIKNEIDEPESVNSYVEKEKSKLEQYKRINAKNDRIMAAWYAQCAHEGKLPPGFELSHRSDPDNVINDKPTEGIENNPTDIDSPFNIEFTPEDKEKIVLDESV